MTIDTAGTNSDGTITFNNTIDGAQDLDLVSDDAAIVITGAIGNSTALGTLDINQGTTQTGNITLTGNIGGSNAGVTGVTRIGNVNTADLNLNGTVYKTDGATTFTAVSGGTIDLGGTSPTFTTSADAITFATAGVKIGAGTLTVNSAGGAISFTGNITGTDNDETVVLNTGSGATANETVAVQVIGGGGKVKAVTILSLIHI